MLMKSRLFDIFKNKYLNHAFIILLVVLLVVFSFFLVKSIWSIRRAGIMNQHKTLTEFFLNHKTSINDVNYIENWMTFHYINFIFKIPENYFKDTLYIDDVRYPNIPLWKYTKEKNIDPLSFLNQVKNALTKFLQQKPVHNK